MKKPIPIFYAAFLLSFCPITFASTSPTGSLYINQVSSTTGYYSVRIHSHFPSNNYEVKGIQTQLPYLLTAINRFIAQNLQGDHSAYIEFGYSDGQDVNEWFTSAPCKIQLPNDESISVAINSKTSCTTYIKAKAID